MARPTPQFLALQQWWTERSSLLEDAVSSYRTRKLIRLRFGLDGEDPQSLAAAGRQFNITEERARQLINGGKREMEEYQQQHMSQQD